MPDSNRHVSRFTIEISRVTDGAVRRDDSQVYVRIYENDDGSAEARPLTSMSTVEGHNGSYGRERLKEALHRYVDEIVARMGDVETADVTLWPKELRERFL